MVGGMVLASRRSRRADDQHHPVLQLQRHSVDPKAASFSDRYPYLAGGDDLGVFGVRAGNAGVRLRGTRRRAAPGALRAPSFGFADRVIHAFV